MKNVEKSSDVQRALPKKMNYMNLLKPKSLNSNVEKVPPKPVVMLRGEPSITWKSSKIKSLIIQENLKYAIIGKLWQTRYNGVEKSYSNSVWY